jgi:hypothetical protein
MKTITLSPTRCALGAGASAVVVAPVDARAPILRHALATN